MLLSRNRKRRGQCCETLYVSTRGELCVTVVGQCWLYNESTGWNGRQVSRTHAAAMLKRWRKGA